jgi:hypothetical protein
LHVGLKAMRQRSRTAPWANVFGRSITYLARVHVFSIKTLAFTPEKAYLVNMTKTQELKTHLRPGRVYRREDLAQWSKAVDRHLKQLVSDGTLTKLSGGLYLYPKTTVFGKAPAEDDKLVGGFLKDKRFLLASPNAYNSLGVGTTQLYDTTVVYNHKRHGDLALGGRKFSFRMKPFFPKTLSREFLLVDLVNNLDQLAESKEEILARVRESVASYDAALRPQLRRAASNYGNVRTKKFFSEALNADMAPHVR